MKKQGFTLIELMIVVAIIAIIAAIAIPNLLRSRMSANEAGAAGAMRTISTGEVGFQTAGFVDADSDGVGDYGTLAQLANPDGAGATPPFIDSVLGGGNKHGYVFTMAVTAGSATTLLTSVDRGSSLRVMVNPAPVHHKSTAPALARKSSSI